MDYTPNTILETYFGSIKHLIDGRVMVITFPPTSANSFTMASAQFEKQALSMSSCGIIIEIVVEKLDKKYKQFKNE